MTGTDQEFWASPCSFLCCFRRRAPDDTASPEALVHGDAPTQYGTMKGEEDTTSWNDLAQSAAEQDNIDEGIVITDDISLNTDTDENIVLTNPDHTEKPSIPTSCTSDEDEASDAHTRTYAKDTVRDEITEAGEGHDIPTFVPSPVPEEVEDAVEEKEVEETLEVLEDAIEPPSITVEAPEHEYDSLSQSVPLAQSASELESASDMDNMGSTQSLTKKKKSKFKKFFKIRKKKKKNKLEDEQYKSTPSLTPGPSEHSQGTIRSVHSMNSVQSNLDPDERNIVSD